MIGVYCFNSKQSFGSSKQSFGSNEGEKKTEGISSDL